MTNNSGMEAFKLQYNTDLIFF